MVMEVVVEVVRREECLEIVGVVARVGLGWVGWGTWGGLVRDLRSPRQGALLAGDGRGGGGGGGGGGDLRKVGWDGSVELDFESDFFGSFALMKCRPRVVQHSPRRRRPFWLIQEERRSQRAENADFDLKSHK